MNGAVEINKKKKMPLSRKIFLILMCAYPIIQFLVFWLYVNFDTIVMSFQKFDYISGKESFAGLDNYKWLFNELMDKKDLKNCILNSVILFAVNNFVILPIAIFCAYIFFKKLPLGPVFRVIFFLPNIISIVVLTMAFSFMFDSSFGPVNSLLTLLHLDKLIPLNGWLSDKGSVMGMVVLYCIWAGIGYDVVLLTGAINRIPTEVIEAGKLDGIPWYKELIQIVVPLIFPTLTTLFVTGVTVIFTIFLQPMLLTNGGPYDHLSGTIALYIVELVNNNQLYRAAAVGIAFSLIGIPIVQLIKWGMEKISPDVDY